MATVIQSSILASLALLSLYSKLSAGMDKAQIDVAFNEAKMEINERCGTAKANVFRVYYAAPTEQFLGLDQATHSAAGTSSTSPRRLTSLMLEALSKTHTGKVTNEQIEADKKVAKCVSGALQKALDPSKPKDQWEAAVTAEINASNACK